MPNKTLPQVPPGRKTPPEKRRQGTGINPAGSHTFTPQEIEALREFHERALRLYWEFGNITSAVYACMIGLTTAQMDGSKTFENFTTLQDAYGNALRTIILAMRAEEEKFDEAERELHHAVKLFADDLKSQVGVHFGPTLRALRYGLLDEKDGEAKN
jgi:hypothetical protein